MKKEEIFKSARKAAMALCGQDAGLIDTLLHQLADRLIRQSEEILVANREDLERMDPGDPKYDRLQLTPQRIAAIAQDIRNVAALESPLGKILEHTVRPNGLHIRKISVPFGVIGIIYEARPNVTLDVFSLCLKSGNACILKGGSDAHASNTALVSVIHSVLEEFGLDENTVLLLPPEREYTSLLLQARTGVDVIIPRGSRQLIDYVREHARVPVIETGAGICHTYFDKEGDRERGREIIYNAKTRRVSVCNALDCLVIHRSRLDELPYLCEKLMQKQVVIYADPPAYAALQGHYSSELLKEATAESFGTEFLDYKMSIRTVTDLGEALEHIARYSSTHSEAVITENTQTAKVFETYVDAACVYVNASTAFTDGAQFGMGAEIGISTQKLHARGPMALRELTTYKYIIEGQGQTRP